jgi:secreted trypsin-like serine protease
LLVLKTSLIALPLSASENTETSGWLYRVYVSDKPVCYGESINQRWLVTAWHCIQLPGASKPFDKNTITIVSLSGEKRQISRIVTLRDRFTHLGELSGRDIALLEVNTGFSHSASIPEQMPHSDDSDVSVLVARDGHVTSKKVTVKKITHKSIYIDPTICKGESGAPLLDANANLIAIASWHAGKNCGTGLSVFNRLDVYRSWISEIVYQKI